MMCTRNTPFCRKKVAAVNIWAPDQYPKAIAADGRCIRPAAFAVDINPCLMASFLQTNRSFGTDFLLYSGISAGEILSSNSRSEEDMRAFVKSALSNVSKWIIHANWHPHESQPPS